MGKGKILVVEDNIITAKHIGNTLKKFGYEITDLVDSLEAVERSVVKNEPDLVILDINLGSNIDGIQIAQILRSEFDLPYLFLTSYNDEKTINGIIKAQPMGYVVKPFNPIDLNAVVELALYKSKHTNTSSSTKSLKSADHNSEEHNDLKDYIFVKNGRNIDRVFIPDVEFIEADGRYTYIHYKGQKKISNASLKVLKEKLEERHFVQTHRSFIVNLTKVETIALHHIHIGKHEVPVGKTYRNELLKGLDVI